MGTSEFLGPQHGHDEIGKEGEGEEADEDDFHGGQGGGGLVQRAFSQNTA